MDKRVFFLSYYFDLLYLYSKWAMCSLLGASKTQIFSVCVHKPAYTLEYLEPLKILKISSPIL
jgi:hypothetical protein